MTEYKIIEKYITPNRYSRPKTKINKIKGIVIHWVANPNTSAIANRNFFENRKYGQSGYGSAHEIIDLNGDVILCIPKDEMAYHVGSKTYTDDALIYLSSYPNNCTYGIECTHIDWNGVMNNETYQTLVQRCADLCIEFDLNPIKDKVLWLHKEVVGWKDCHKWFVDNPQEWINFKDKVIIAYQEKIEEMIRMELKAWQRQLGEEAIDNLHKKDDPKGEKLLNNPEQWKNTLGESVPQWLLWVMLDRITNK